MRSNSVNVVFHTTVLRLDLSDCIADTTVYVQINQDSISGVA